MSTASIQWTVYLAIFVTLAGLTLLAYMGWYNRYWSDDWCYNLDFKNLGIWGTINTYFMTGKEALRGYSNNRYSLTLLSGLLSSTGILGAQITASLVILCWLLGLLWVLFNLSKLSGYPSKNILVLGAVILLYYTLYTSPQRFQILYWMAGIHYSFSVITGIFLVGLVMYQLTRETRSKVLDYLAIPLAFIAGGFSETGCAFLLSGAILALLTAWYWKQKRAAWAVKAFPTILIIFLSLLASLVVLALSPSNIARREFLSTEQTAPLTALILSFRFAVDFMIDSFRSQPLPNLMFIIAFVSLSILSGNSQPEQRNHSFWKTILSALAVVVIVWLIISAVQAPTALFYGTPPDPRGKSIARFTMLAGLAVIAWMAGQPVNFSDQNKLFIVLALLGMTLNVVYTARSITNVHAELPGFMERARLWDQRDVDIRSALAQGQTRLEVIVIEMKDIHVRDIMSGDALEKGWVSVCGSRYYGLEAIKGIQP